MEEMNDSPQSRHGIWHKSLELYDLRDILVILALGVAALLALKALLK